MREHENALPAKPEALPTIADATRARIAIERYRRNASLRDSDKRSLKKVVEMSNRSAEALKYIETEGHEGSFPSVAELRAVESFMAAADSGGELTSDYFHELGRTIQKVIDEPHGYTDEYLPMITHLSDVLERWELAEHQLIGSYGTENS